jgi:hypothetical protein
MRCNPLAAMRTLRRRSSAARPSSATPGRWTSYSAFMMQLQNQCCEHGGWGLCRPGGALGVTTGELLENLSEAGKAALHVANRPA